MATKIKAETTKDIFPYITELPLMSEPLSVCPSPLVMASPPFPSVVVVVVVVDVSVVVGEMLVEEGDGGSSGVLDAFPSWKAAVGGDVPGVLQKKGCSPTKDVGLGELLG